MNIISMVIYYHHAKKMYQELLPEEGALVFNAINFCRSPAVSFIERIQRKKEMNPSVPDSNRITATKHHFSSIAFLNRSFHSLWPHSQTSAGMATKMWPRPVSRAWPGCGARQSRRLSPHLHLSSDERGSGRKKHADKLIKGKGITLTRHHARRKGHYHQSIHNQSYSESRWVIAAISL